MIHNLCIYHGNCADGFTSAWVVRQALGAYTEFHAGFFNSPTPEVKGMDVYIVDFSYPRAVMEQIVTSANKVVHIDHHETAINAMQDFTAPNLLKVYSYENTESGAMLTWKHFYPEKDVPQLIKHVDDRDRWKFLIPGTREFQANMFSYEYTFENWDMLLSQDVQAQIRDGAAIERKDRRDIKLLSSLVVRRMNIAGFNVPVANVSPFMGSEMCNRLARNEPFSAYYYDTPDGRMFGLRSLQGTVNVAKIAESYGGGGHENASGFRMSYEDAKKFEI